MDTKFEKEILHAILEILNFIILSMILLILQTIC